LLLVRYLYWFILVGVAFSQVSPEEPFHITVGKVDIWKVQDSWATQRPYTSLFPNLKLSDWNGLLDFVGKPYIDAQGLFFSNMSFSGTLIHSEDSWILVDDGIGVVDPIVPSNQTRRIPDLIKLAGVDPEMLNHVVLSHFHADHTGWNVFLDPTKNLKLEFPNAIYIAQQDEIDYWSSTPSLKNTSHYNEVIQPVIDSGLLVGVKGQGILTNEVRLVPCKGHTPGHQCVYVRSQGQSAVIIGDVMHHPVQVQMQDWSAVFDWNTTISVPTRKEVILNIVQEQSLLIAPHFQFPGIGKVVKDPAGSGGGRSGLIYEPIECC